MPSTPPSAVAPGVPLGGTGGVARVVRVERGACLVAADGHARTVPASVPVAVGDWVRIGAGGCVSEVVPRSTEIRRTRPSGQAVDQVLAANVDVVAVCVPLEPDPRVGRTERLLAVAWSSGAQPVLIATKADLCPPAEVDGALARLGMVAPGVEVMPVTIADAATVEPVREVVVPDRTMVVLGASGVGKSTLINALLGEERLATTAVRADGRGRHTTAWRELVELPGGGSLIDTPGLREVGLVDAHDGVEAVFAEIGEYGARCRFRDCRHDSEPGCEVRRAVEAGELDPARLRRYRKLEREVDYQARRFDARARSEHTRRWIATVKRSRPSRP